MYGGYFFFTPVQRTGNRIINLPHPCKPMHYAHFYRRYLGPLRLRSLFVKTNWVCMFGAIFNPVTRVGLS